MTQPDAGNMPAAQPAKELRSQIPVRLSSGRIAIVNLPMPMAAEELLELIALLPPQVAQANLQLIGGRRLELPNGQQVPVLPPT